MTFGTRTRIATAFCVALTSLAAAAVTPGAAPAAQGPAAKPGKAKGAEEPAPVKGRMNLLFGALQEALPLAIDARNFTDPKKAKTIRSSLGTIRDTARSLETHGKPGDPSFAYVAKSLEDSARDALFWMTRGDADEARFITLNLAENCISCHTNLPETAKYPPSTAFFGRLKREGLTVNEQVTLLIASRDFDGALDAMEKELQAPPRAAVAGAMPSLNQALVDEYLKVAVRVKQDPARARKTLEALRAARQMPLYLAKQVDQWIAGLTRLEKEKLLDDVSLANAERLIKAGTEAQDFPMDRNGNVYFIAASSILNRLLQDPKLGDERKSEVFYDLGLTEVLIGRNFWLSKAEFYLENAIRLNPRGPHTLKAYAMLERELHAGYEGKTGNGLPVEKAKLLDELYRMLPADAKGPAR